MTLTREQSAALKALGFCHHARVYAVATTPARIVVCLACGGIEEDDVGPVGHITSRSWRFPSLMERVCKAFHREIVGPAREETSP